MFFDASGTMAELDDADFTSRLVQTLPCLRSTSLISQKTIKSLIKIKSNQEMTNFFLQHNPNELSPESRFLANTTNVTR